MSDQYVTAKNTLLKKYKIGFWMIFILALSGHFSVSAANMPDAQDVDSTTRNSASKTLRA